MESAHYDLVVLGAGPAGEKAAAQAAYWGKRVAVVDRQRRPGGTMIGGAVSSKTMREAALYLTGFRRRDVYQVGLDLAPEAAVERLRHRTTASRSSTAGRRWAPTARLRSRPPTAARRAPSEPT